MASLHRITTPQTQRSPIILEVGMMFVKVGFAGDSAPIAIVPSLGRLPNGNLTRLFGPMRLAQRMEILTTFLSDLYFKVLLCNARDRKVVVLLNPFEPHDIEKALLAVLLTVLEVPGVSLVSPHMTIFPAIGIIHTGLIIDIGSVTRIIPVAHNAAIVGSWEVLPHIGFSGLVRFVKEGLSTGCDIRRIRLPSDDSAYSEDSAEMSSIDSIESLKQSINVEELCLELDFPPFPDINRLTVEAGEKRVELRICGTFLEKIMETFFQHDLDGNSLPSAILEVILKVGETSTSFRWAMMENMIVVGGVAAVKNFLPRLNAELSVAARDSSFVEKLRQPKFRFVSTQKIPTNIVGWSGSQRR
ncbi:putative Actin-related protein 10 [Hypsibius exemplaris]|uniref:Actin-related protein 10 n=1 Tax=Hypsibius exemplaris TaxID=2072580 RepID=A0A1W0WGL9_HYPEX|nr:putative Actin-related protein 10 [Hypsibius exemplaris]